MMMSHRVNNLRRVFGRPYWPTAERVKRWPETAHARLRPAAPVVADAA